jgi:hypothetical protein
MTLSFNPGKDPMKNIVFAGIVGLSLVCSLVSDASAQCGPRGCGARRAPVARVFGGWRPGALVRKIFGR